MDLLKPDITARVQQKQQAQKRDHDVHVRLREFAIGDPWKFPVPCQMYQVTHLINILQRKLHLLLHRQIYLMFLAAPLYRLLQKETYTRRRHSKK